VRVLFVDDEPNILSGLGRMLRSQRDWEVFLANSGEEALAQSDVLELDAIVSDMRMPGMDGVAVLTEMRRRHPEVARIILSGQTGQRDVLRSLSVAHQSLSKPCGPSELVGAVQRACDLQERLGDAKLRQVLGRVDSLPSPSAVILELRATMARDDVDIADVDSVISSDVGMSAKVLQLVNSAFFGLARHVDDIRDALAYLGLDVVHELVVATEVFRSAEQITGLPRTLVEEVRAHSTAVALAASLLAEGTPLHQQAFVSGLLHDIGWLALAAQVPEALPGMAARVAQGHILHDVELDVFGATHADVGGYLLSLWGLPTGIAEAVARHHDAELMPHRVLDLPHLVHLADIMASTAGLGLPQLEGELTGVGEGYVEALGASERLEQARAALGGHEAVTP
jgi:HD-like signal output (HDOD) protein/CheY-like chemotaxis protein